MILGKTVKNITRLSEVINTLLRFGFEDVIANTGLKKFIPAQSKFSNLAEDGTSEYNRWERIRMVIEELGATYIKFAQLLSTRPDILPEALIHEFTKLQSNVPPFSTKVAKKIIEKELNKPISEVFSYFDGRTVGSGSIGQVHRAKLLRGEDVVIKVQRPDAEYKISTDLRLLREFIKHTESYFVNIGILNPIEIIDTFEESMLKELDYKNEITNILRFRKIYAGYKGLHIPKPYKNVSTSKVLITEFASGCEITNIKQLHDWGINTKEIAEKMAALYLMQIFEKGYFHADPHPGNILVRPDKQIVLIDFGMTGRLTQRQKYDFAGLSIAIAQKNVRLMAVNLRKLSIGGEISNMKIFEHDLEKLVDDFDLYNIEDNGLSDLIGRLQHIVFQYKLRIPSEIFLVLRALAIIESIGKQLHPNFKTTDFILPYGKKILKEQYSTINMVAEAQYSISQIVSLLYSSPLDIKYILKKIRKGQLHLNIELKGLDKFYSKLDVLSNKLASSFIISALLIGSSIVLSSANETTTSFVGIPVVSTIGYGLALALSIWLAIYNLRNKK